MSEITRKINVNNPVPDAFFFVDDKGDKIEQVKDPEERNYLIIFVGVDTDTDNEFRGWDYYLGRTKVRDALKSLVENENIDIHNSKVFSEKSTIMDALSVYDFFKKMEGLYDDGFDIEDFNVGDVE